MNIDALLPTTEPILCESHHALGARSTFLLSCHLCIWQNITGKLICTSTWEFILSIYKKNQFLDHILQ